MSAIPYFGGAAALGLRTSQLVARILEQVDETLVHAELPLSSSTTAVVQVLFHTGPQSLAAIAERLQISHQLTSQRVNRLHQLGLASIRADPHDGRRRVVQLTAEGGRVAEQFQHYLARIERAFIDLFDEIEVDLHQAVLCADAALERRSLAERMDHDTP